MEFSFEPPPILLVGALLYAPLAIIVAGQNSFCYNNVHMNSILINEVML